MKLAIATTLLTAASAFVTPHTGYAAPKTAVVLSMSEEEAAVEEEAAPEPEPEPVVAASACISKEAILAEPNTLEFGSIWDPLNLAETGSDETLAWFRHAEVKHGRVAMAAFVGWWAIGAGVHFPGNLATGIEFGSLPSKGLEAWDAVPGWGKAQMLLLAGLIEFHDELFFSRRGEHYLRGGTPGKNMVPGLYDPLGLGKNKSEETLARGRAVEIKNGRLAMIGVAGMYFATTIPGSVPFQPAC